MLDPSSYRCSSLPPHKLSPSDFRPRKAQVRGGFARWAWGSASGMIPETSLCTSVSLRSLGVGRFTLQAFLCWLLGILLWFRDRKIGIPFACLRPPWNLRTLDKSSTCPAKKLSKYPNRFELPHQQCAASPRFEGLRHCSDASRRGTEQGDDRCRSLKTVMSAFKD